MPINGFEQLFINLTNEWIQNLFNHVMFQRELETYREEDARLTLCLGSEAVLSTLHAVGSPDSPLQPPHVWRTRRHTRLVPRDTLSLAATHFTPDDRRCGGEVGLRVLRDRVALRLRGSRPGE